MEYMGEFDYFYGKESERYHFITIPKLLLTDEYFKGMSAEAKLLYGCLLDRNSLSQKNGWLDEKNRVYVLYSIENMKQDLGCASEKVNKVLKELEAAGLIFRMHKGVGKANHIYVMDYMAYYRKEDLRVRKSKAPYSKIESDHVRKSKSNKTNNNITDSNIYTPKENISGKRSYRKKKNSFNDYAQREYDYEELERMLLKNNHQHG